SLNEIGLESIPQVQILETDEIGFPPESIFNTCTVSLQRSSSSPGQLRDPSTSIKIMKSRMGSARIVGSPVISLGLVNAITAQQKFVFKTLVEVYILADIPLYEHFEVQPFKGKTTCERPDNRRIIKPLNGITIQSSYLSVTVIIQKLVVSHTKLRESDRSRFGVEIIYRGKIARISKVHSSHHCSDRFTLIFHMVWGIRKIVLKNNSVFVEPDVRANKVIKITLYF